MSYSAGKRLSGETASKLGHLEIVKNPLVKEIVEQLEEDNSRQFIPSLQWEPIPDNDALKIIFVVDGSYQVVRSERFPYKEVAFVKTVLLRYNQKEFERLDPIAPHPMALRDILSNAALYHATVLPLRGIRLKKRQLYDALREIIFASINDPALKGEPYNTLKWLAYEKWTEKKEIRSPKFECPHCEKEIPGLPYDKDKDQCPYCGKEVYLTDMIGFHLEMDDDYAPESIVTSYMLIHETLMLFTAIRIVWENYIERINNILFLKDGPLSLRGQYSKLVIPIRKFLEFAVNKGYKIHIVGQEKNGLFVDHFRAIQDNVPDNRYATLSESYIRNEIQHNPRAKEPYGLRTNYGGKVFLKLEKNQFFVLNIALKTYTANPKKTDFIGLESSISTIPLLKNYKHENALTPIVLANGIASLSSYPSATVLKLFAGI